MVEAALHDEIQIAKHGDDVLRWVDHLYRARHSSTSLDRLTVTGTRAYLAINGDVWRSGR